jgi:hypothetical protein
MLRYVVETNSIPIQTQLSTLKRSRSAEIQLQYVPLVFDKLY